MAKLTAVQINLKRDEFCYDLLASQGIPAHPAGPGGLSPDEQEELAPRLRRPSKAHTGGGPGCPEPMVANVRELPRLQALCRHFLSAGVPMIADMVKKLYWSGTWWYSAQPSSVSCTGSGPDLPPGALGGYSAGNLHRYRGDDAGPAGVRWTGATVISSNGCRGTADHHAGHRHSPDRPLP